MRDWIWLIVGIAVVFTIVFVMVTNRASADAGKVAGNNSAPKTTRTGTVVPGGGGAVYGDGSAAGGTGGFGEIWT